MPDDRPPETGWLPDTPYDDTLMRQFLLNQSELNATIATACGGRVERTDLVALADTGGPIPYFNQAVLLQPIVNRGDSAMAEIRSFYAPVQDRPVTLLSIWPTPDLTPLGWSLVGHPAFMVRGAFPFDHQPAPGVELRSVTTADDLMEAERIMIEGYPLNEAAGLPRGTVFPGALLDRDLLIRLGVLDGAAVACATRFIAEGLVNLCMAATLPQARRRGVWEALVWARLRDAPGLPAVAYTSDFSRPGFQRMGFLPITRFTLWARSSNA